MNRKKTRGWKFKKKDMIIEFGLKVKKIRTFIRWNAEVARHPKELNALIFDMEGGIFRILCQEQDGIYKN